jgi:AraC-like DNA-binding protein
MGSHATDGARRRGEVTFIPSARVGALRAAPAERSTPTLVALNLAPAALLRLTNALRGRARVQDVRTCRELIRIVQDGGARSAVVELKDAQGTPTAPTVRWLREHWPLLPVLGYCASANPDGAALLAAAQAGLTGLLVAGSGSGDERLSALGEVLEALQQAEDEVTARRAWAAVAAEVPEPARVVVEYCLRHGRKALTVDDLARALGMHRKTLWGRLGRAGLPSPERVINWARLLHAAQRLETTDTPLSRVAAEYEYGTPGALRNMLQRYANLTPAVVKRPGGFEAVLATFRAGLCERPESPPAKGRGAGRAGERAAERAAARQSGRGAAAAAAGSARPARAASHSKAQGPTG